MRATSAARRTAVFPDRAKLAAFFKSDPGRRIRIRELALLLGASTDRVRRMLRVDDLDRRSDAIEWGEAASYLFDAWPRARIVAALGPELARLIPPAFHPVAVQWGIPLFVIQAMEHQAAQAGQFMAPSVDDYVADILFNEIRPATVGALSGDGAFLEAYGYPPLDD